MEHPQPLSALSVGASFGTLPDDDDDDDDVEDDEDDDDEAPPSRPPLEVVPPSPAVAQRPAPKSAPPSHVDGVAIA